MLNKKFFNLPVFYFLIIRPDKFFILVRRKIFFKNSPGCFFKYYVWTRKKFLQIIISKRTEFKWGNNKKCLIVKNNEDVNFDKIIEIIKIVFLAYKNKPSKIQRTTKTQLEIL